MRETHREAGRDGRRIYHRSAHRGQWFLHLSGIVVPSPVVDILDSWRPFSGSARKYAWKKMTSHGDYHLLGPKQPASSGYNRAIQASLLRVSAVAVVGASASTSCTLTELAKWDKQRANRPCGSNEAVLSSGLFRSGTRVGRMKPA